jgi:hypothetical protein
VDAESMSSFFVPLSPVNNCNIFVSRLRVFNLYKTVASVSKYEYACVGILAAKVERRDSLARFLSNRPARRDLIERNIIPSRTDAERQEDRHIIGYRLNRFVVALPFSNVGTLPMSIHSMNFLKLQQQQLFRGCSVLNKKLFFSETVTVLLCLV